MRERPGRACGSFDHHYTMRTDVRQPFCAHAKKIALEWGAGRCFRPIIPPKTDFQPFRRMLKMTSTRHERGGQRSN